jgi:isopentenyldiphosphate isomerase
MSSSAIEAAAVAMAAATGAEANAHRLDLAAEESFDVLTPEGAHTGQSKLRRLVHAHGDWHASVHIWLVHSRTGHILVQKRAALKDSFPSCWDVSCAGHVSAGESVRAATEAELREELGLTRPTSTPYEQFFRSLCVMPREVISQHGKFIDREHTTIYLVEGAWEAPSDFTLQVEEVEAVRWMELEELLAHLRAGSDGFVPIPDLDAYKAQVFDPIAVRIKAIRAHTSASG